MDPDASGPDGRAACRLVREGEPFIGKQGLVYAVGISAETVGARGIHMQIVRIPPAGRAKAHKHEAHEQESVVLLPELEHWVPSGSTRG